jgi:hypothetical protein
VEIDFAVSDDEALRLIERLRAESISIFYVRTPMEYGTVDGNT